MEQKRNAFSSAKFRRGFAGLAILIVVVIMMLLMMMQMKTFFRTPSESGKSITDINRPWLQCDKILDSDRLITMPDPPKPDMSKPIRIVTKIHREENPRGGITIEFTPNGEVSGNWQCSYAHEDRTYSYTADFKGNIDIEETYVDPDGKEDESKLFFITKGRFTKTTVNQSSDVSSETEGDVYVTGWLSPDHSAHGRITITTDETWSAVYTWNAGAK
jgi:hypothetical protein